ncbi:hypothetical protein SDC9_80810 [bioreactor metagenome]|uniref:Type I restriction modification DNA specificity domain-containing protein n=1 Tax=bioreactor metagenome TaxID=1076179 RepID=A0A644Z1Q2_9ZZZZ
MSNWEMCRLGQFIGIKHGFAFKGMHITDIPSRYILVTPGNFHIGGGFKADKPKYYLEIPPPEYILKGDDIIVTMTDLSKESDTLGYSAKVPRDGKIYLHNQRIGLVNFINTEAHPEFIYWLMRTRDYQSYIVGSASGTSIMHTSPNRIKDYKFKCPSITEQKAIAGVLSCLDHKIDLLNRQNKILEAMAETLFRQWFIEEAEDDWEEKSLSSVANFINGIACQKFPPENEVDKLPVLKIKELRNGFSTDCDYSSTNIDRKYIVQRGDIIFSWSASLMVKIWDGEDCILNQHLFKVISDEYPKWFIYFWCKQHLAEFISISTSHATTMGHIKREDIDNSKVLVPSAARLRDRSNLMNSLLDKVLINFKQIESLLEQRDMLLPKLMSGELRVDLIGRANETK